MTGYIGPSNPNDIVRQLRNLAPSCVGIMGQSVLMAAADELDRLREVERRLRKIEGQPDFRQADRWGYERGYKQAQFDIRQALGIDND